MAKRKRGTSAHTKYRHAREHLASLEAQYATVERSRPRTPGKRGVRTRALNALSRRLVAARGLLTKARNAVAAATRSHAVAKRSSKRQRSEAARRGWVKRYARTSSGQSGDIWQHLMPDGATRTVILDKTDSSLEGKFWNAYGVALEGRGDLHYFDDRAVFDLDTQQRFRFVTDLDLIAEHADEIDFGPGFYKRRNDTPRDAA